MVKPARLGSSVGMTLAHAAEERAAALDEAFRYDDLALVERYLAGARELEVSVIGQRARRARALRPGRDHVRPRVLRLRREVHARPVARRRPAPRSRRGAGARCCKLARDAYRAIGAEGFARIDFLLAGETLVVSEINTIPGFTPISLFPALCAEGGYDFAAVCRRIVDLALARDRSRVRHRLTPGDLPR